MELKLCLEKIDRFIKKKDVLPFIVDVQNSKDLDVIIDRYNIGDNRLIRASELSGNDEFPQLDKLYNILSKSNGVTIVTNTIPFLKLQGVHVLKSTLNTFSNLNVPGNVIFVTYQCSEYLQFKDPRVHERIAIVEGERTSTPNLVFIKSEDLRLDTEYTIKGIEKIAEIIESRNNKTLHIITKHGSDEFPNSMFRISELKNSYDTLCKLDDTTRNLKTSFGTESQWNYALSLIKKHNCWENVIENILSNKRSLDLLFSQYGILSDDNKWLHFIGLKLYGGGKEYLDLVLNLNLRNV